MGDPKPCDHHQPMGGQLACKQQWLTSEVNCGKLLLEEVYEKLYEVVHVPFRTLLEPVQGGV